MRKWISFTLLAGIAVIVLTGCGSSSNTQENHVRVKGDGNTVNVSNNGSQSSTASGNSADTNVKGDIKVKP